MNRLTRLAHAPQDRAEWQRWYYKTQQDYLRRRLKALRLLWDGGGLEATSAEMGIQVATLRGWVDKYLEGGYERLLEPIRHRKPQRLSEEDKARLKAVVLNESPRHYGLETDVWTAVGIRHLLSTWGIALQPSRIYEVLAELGLSHQRAQRQYLNADPAAQKAFVETLKKTPTPGRMMK